MTNTCIDSTALRLEHKDCYGSVKKTINHPTPPAPPFYSVSPKQKDALAEIFDTFITNSFPGRGCWFHYLFPLPFIRNPGSITAITGS
jgi:hypothetical protein